MRTRRLPLPGFFCLFGLILAGCGGSEPPRSIVLVSIDTLRADRLGSYGHPDGLSPNLDGLASQGVLFEDATAPTPITLPSHASMLTGRYPTATGVRNNGTFVVPDGEVTLPEVLRDEGWDTGAVIAAFPLKRRFGVAQGFRLFDDEVEPSSGRRDGGLRINYVERDAASVTDRAIQVWRSLGERRFLWVHYYDPHTPYAPPEPYASRHASAYDGEVAFTDAQLGRLLDEVREDDPRAIVAVVADHGEALGDHGEETHGVFVYQSTLRVPFLLRAPGLPAGARVSAPVSLVDLMPTLLALAGAPAPAGIEGVDLLPVIADGALPLRPLYAESHLPRLDYRFAELTVWRQGALKYIDAPEPELYDLAQDPGETRNLHGAHPDGDSLVEELAGFLAAADAGAPERASGSLDAEAEAKLRSLGYLAGGAPDVPRDGRGRDPKTMVDYFRRQSEANAFLAAGRNDLGIAVLRELVEQAPENYMLHEQIASALIVSERYAEAEGELELLVAAAPEFATGHRLLAETRARLGKVDAAIGSYRDAARAAPGMARPHFALGTKLEGWNRHDDAAAAYLEAIRLEPTEPRYSRRLVEMRDERDELALVVGELTALADETPSAALRTSIAVAERARNQPAAALEQLRLALEIEPYHYDALLQVGEIQAGGGRGEVAETAFRRAIEADGNRVDGHFGLGRALLVQDRREEAERALARALEIDPGFAPAHSELGLYLESKGDLAGARDAYRAALAINPGDPRARQGLARLPR